MGLCFLPVIYLGPNYGGGNEDNGDLLQNVLCRHYCILCPQLLSRPLPTHACTRDSWTLMGKSGSVSRGSLLLSPGSWCAQGAVRALPEFVSLVLCEFWWLRGRLLVTSSRRAYAIPRCTAPRAPAAEAGRCWPGPPQETPRLSSVSVFVGSLGPGAHKVCFSPLSVSGRYGV